MKRFVRFLAAAILFTGFAACNDDDNNNNNPSTRTFSAHLMGSSEVPANASAAMGEATIILDEANDTFDATVTFTGLTATASHIHKGAIGVPGPAIFPFSDLTSPITLNDVAITTAQQADLKNGLYYVNVHSAAYPDGEIRGQLTED